MVDKETVPKVRITAVTAHAARDSGEYVLYWMTAARRLRYNFGLQRAVEWANKLQRPLLIFDAVRTNYRWACDRFHQFLIDGIVERSTQLSSSKAAHLAYIEPDANHGAGLMETLAEHACIIVADDYPCFFHPALYRKIAAKWGWRFGDCRLQYHCPHAIARSHFYGSAFVSSLHAESHSRGHA